MAITSFLLRFAVLCTLLWSCGAGAVGATGEESALADVMVGRYPLTLSGDGLWLFHADGNSMLYKRRIRADGVSLETRLQLPGVVRALSASQDGSRVAFVSRDGCVGVASFGKKPSYAWVPSPSKAADSDKDGRICSGFVRVERIDDYDDYWPNNALALSGDGKWLAVEGHPVRIVNAVNGKLLTTVPSGYGGNGYWLLHLRFLEAGRKLLMVLVKSGERWESPALRSDIEFLVWDLQRKELHNAHRTGASRLILYDYLWHFSETTGVLWAINTKGRYWDEAQPAKPARIKPYAINLKQCDAKIATRLDLPPGDDRWHDFAADPLNRWVATVEPLFDAKSNLIGSRLGIWAVGTGKLLAQWKLDSALKSLQPSIDGLNLFGIFAGLPKPRADQPYGSYSGGGRLMRFDLAPYLQDIAVEAARDWATQRCLLDDEIPEARDIRAPLAESKLAYAIELNGSCSSGDQSRPGRCWGRTPDDHLWIDRGDRLERIDPASGKVVQTVATPRSESIFGFPLYARNRFLVWQGDTVALRPLIPGADAPPRQRLVRKPGWMASSVIWLDDRFFVRWVDVRVFDVKAPGKEGSEVGILYDLNGKVLNEIRGGLDENNRVGGKLDGMNEGAYESDLFDFETMQSSESPYVWNFSVAGSVRAGYRDPASGRTRTLLWAGLKPGAALSSGGGYRGGMSRYFLAPVGPAGVVAQRGRVDVFDAVKRAHLASISVEPDSYVVGVAWFESAGMLLIEKGDESALFAYRVRKP